MAKADKDFIEHQNTYDRFMKITKYAVLATIVLVLFLHVAINP